MLRRLKILGADNDDLKEVYEKHTRSIVEFGTPVVAACLTVEEKMDIERIQRTATYIILGQEFSSYQGPLILYALTL